MTDVGKPYDDEESESGDVSDNAAYSDKNENSDYIPVLQKFDGYRVSVKARSDRYRRFKSKEFFIPAALSCKYRLYAGKYLYHM